MSLILKAPSVIQFENENSGRKYPFDDSSTLISDSGRRLPDDVVSDMRLAVPSSGPSIQPARLSCARISPSMVSVCVMIGTAASRMSLSCTAARKGYEPYVPRMLEPLDGTLDASGVITLGDFKWPSSTEAYFFSEASQSGVSASCVTPFFPPSLKAFIDDRNGKSVSGDARIEFSRYVSASSSGSSALLSLDEGAADALKSSCSGMTFRESCGAIPVTSINGVRPDSKGRIVIHFR